jgi:hypothetical protein
MATHQNQEGPTFPVCHANRIYIGVQARTFREVFLRPLLALRPFYRLRGYVLDLSPTAELLKAIQEAEVPPDVRDDLRVVQVKPGTDALDEAATEAIWELVGDCDPGLRPNEVILESDPGLFPKLAKACWNIASRWYHGGHSPASEEAWPFTGLPRRIAIEDLRARLTRHEYPHRARALLIAGGDGRDAFGAEVLTTAPSWLSFVQLAGPKPSGGVRSLADLWPWPDSPSLVFSDGQSFEAILARDRWSRAVCVVAADGPERTAESILVPWRRDRSRRAQLPAVVLTWSPQSPQAALRAWVTQPLAPAARSLPRARDYEARPEVEGVLREVWRKGRPCVLALIGPGGSGKTAVAQHFLEGLQQTRVARESEAAGADLPPADAQFVWDFYLRPRAEAFLRSFAEYLSSGGERAKRDEENLELIGRRLEERDLRRTLLVMDGLERIQRTSNGPYAAGELQSPLVLELLERIAAGQYPIVALVTTRLEPVQLRRHLDQGFRVLDVGSLPAAAAIQILRNRGVRGDDARLSSLAEHFGGHAMTLDHLGRFLHDFYDGDPDAPDRFPQITRIFSKAPSEEIDLINRQIVRLFAGYEDRLPEPEVAILQRVAALDWPVDAGEFGRIFLGSGEEQLAGPLAGVSDKDLEGRFEALEQRQLLTVWYEPGQARRYATHPVLSDYFARAFADDVESFNLGAAAYLEQLATTQTGKTGPTRAALHTRGAVRTRGASVGARSPQEDYPREPAVLDILERLIFHTVRAGRREEARRIYEQRLGGTGHLVAIGQEARAQRVGSWLVENTSQKR